jgi:hypothetical protein
MTSKVMTMKNSPTEVVEVPEVHTPGWRPRKASVEEGSTELMMSTPVDRRIGRRPSPEVDETPNRIPRRDKFIEAKLDV